MSLRLKLLSIFFISLAALLGSLYMVSRGTLMKSFLFLEEQVAYRDLFSIRQAIQNELLELEVNANDWGPWDDTYRFVQDQNQDYIDNNLNTPTLVNLGLNLFLVLDTAGDPVYGIEIDLAAEQKLSLSAEVADYFNQHRSKYQFTQTDQSVRGIVSLPDGLLMIAACPILTSLNEGPVQGTLVFGRYVDQEFLDRVAVADQELAVFSKTDPVLPDNGRGALAALSVENPSRVVLQGDERVLGSLLVEDLDGVPAGLITSDSPQSIYPQGIVIVQNFLALIAGIFLVATFLMWLMLDHMVIERIVNVYSQVDRVGTSRDFSARIETTGKDEIARLAASFDQVLQIVLHSQKALQASEEKHRILVENLVDWVWEIDTHNAFCYSSSRIRDLLGYAPYQVIGKSLFDLMFDRDAEEAQQILAPCFDEKKAFELVTLRFMHDSGKPVTMEVSGSPIFSSQAEFLGYRGISRDVTEHWAIENALHESEKKYRTLFNYIPDAVFIYDRITLQLLDWNQALTRIYGYNETELHSLTLLDLYPPEDAEKAKRELESPDLDCPIQTVHVTKHGRRMSVEILMEAIVYQGKPAWIALVRDITERKRTEDALRLERDIVQSIFASSPDAITIVDLNGTIIDCNQALLKMFGRTRKEEVIGDTIFDSLAPSELKSASLSLVETIEQGLMRNVEFICRRAGGGLFPTENSAGLLRDPDGTPRYIVILSKDITERKRAERIQSATFRISQAANVSETLDELFPSIYTILNELFPARNLFFALYDAEKDEVSFPFFVDEYDPAPAPKKPGKGLTEYVLRTGRPLLITPAIFDELVALGEVESIGSPSLDWLGVPLKAKDRTIGALVTQTYDENRRLGEQEINILTFVSDQVAMVVERKLAEASRKKSETRLRRITDNMLDVISETDANGLIRYASPSHRTVLGYQPEDLVGKPILDLVHPSDRDKFVENLQSALKQRTAVRLELRFHHADGRTLWMEMMSNPLENEADTTIGAVHGCRDISDRKRTEEALRESEERYRNLVEYQGEGICILDPHYRFLFANPAAEKIFGVEPDGLTGSNLLDFTDPESQEILHSQREQREAGIDGTYEITVVRTTGERHNLLITSTPWMDANGDYIGSFTIFRDISERKRVEEKLQFLSMHDVLTGLFNRAYFDEQLNRAECEQRYPASVVFIDLNGLKVTNDTLGHAAGDELLRQTAILLRTAFRGDDIVARLGGDEFGILLPGADTNAAEKAVHRLRARIAEHNRQQGGLQISLSIGCATAADGESMHEVLNLADKRMYADKPRQNRN